MEKIQFDFFRGMDAEQYTFYRIPKILFTAEYFRPLSCEAKVLYGLLLDRMGLSIKNRWLDEEDRVYIIFKIEEIVELMNCGSQKAVKLLKELDTDKGMGLIEKKRLGLGKPNVIYVKNFILQQDGDSGETFAEEASNINDCENQNSEIMEISDQEICTSESRSFRENGFTMAGNMTQEYIKPQKLAYGESYASEILEGYNQECPEPQSGKSETHNSRMIDNIDQDSLKSPSRIFENYNSGMMKTTILEFPKSPSNNTNISETDISKNEYSETDFKEPESVSEESSFLNLIQSNQNIYDRVEMLEKMVFYRDVIRENISYKCFQDERYHRKDEVDELVELMVEVMVMPDDVKIRIAGAEKPAAIVKSRFMKLNQGHMEYIMSCLGANTKKVGNIRSYLLTVLYNATLTVNNYYMAEVNHDLYGNGAL